MPLIPGKSNEAFESNVKAEKDAGKPNNQALAIAYSMRRRAKKMADGGMLDDDTAPASAGIDPKMIASMILKGAVLAAEGGMIEGDDDESEAMPMEHDDFLSDEQESPEANLKENIPETGSLLESIMKKRLTKR